MSLVAISSGPSTAQTVSSAAWSEDLDFLVSELEVRHADLYHTISKAKFEAAVDSLNRRLDRLDHAEVIVELARLTARIGDGHTGLFLPWGRGFDFRRLPVEFHHGEDGYFVLAAASEYRDIVGARVLEIGRVSVQEAVDAIVPLLPRDNEHVLPSFAGTYMRLAELLHTLGLAEDADAIPLLIEQPGGDRREITLRPRPADDPVEWHFLHDTQDLPLYLRRRNEQYWFEYLPQDGTVFLQFNSADIGSGDQEAEFSAFADSLVEFIRTRDAKQLVIDLRWNSGGSFLRTRHLLWAVIRSERVNRTGRLFTIIGPDTFSAATALAVELEQHTNTLFVGQPSGGRPNSFGDLGRIMLPNSSVEVWYSRWAMHQSQPSDHRPAIYPHLRARPSAHAYRRNADPAMDAIRAYVPRIPIVERLRPVLADEGITAALSLHRRLEREAFNVHDFGEGQLNALGYELLADEQAGVALAVFKRNLDMYPCSPNSYDSMADAYRALGRYDEAIDHYLKAFAIDKQYSHSWEAARALRRMQSSHTDEN